MPPDDIQAVAPPWKLKGTIYILAFWSTKAQLEAAGDILYSPLEGSSPFVSASQEGGRHIGGLSMIQVIRYTESPVGPYDELIVTPGAHEYVVEENGRRVTKRNVRITRIYVSQKYTCWNGRKNWNIPKHLARFDFKDDPDGTTQIKVFPHDTSGDPSEATPSTIPFFQATFKPMRYVPSFPTTTGLLKYVGVDITLVQPPLPEGKGSQNELPGTEQWCSIVPGEHSKKTSLGWFDLRQRADGQGEETLGEHENFWPKLGRWHVGVKMADADIEFPEATYWDAPKSVL